MSQHLWNSNQWSIRALRALLVANGMAWSIAGLTWAYTVWLHGYIAAWELSAGRFG